MKFTNFIKSTSAALAIALISLMPASAAAIAAGSLPYEGAATQGTSFPAFNVYNNVPSVVNEADFIRLKKDGAANSTLSNLVNTTCKTGDRFVVWFYVHNGANPAGNADGSAVAKNVIAKVGLPTADASSFNITGGLTSSNAESVNDNASLNCGTGTFKLKYVADSAGAYLEEAKVNVAVPNSIVTTGGAPIGSVAGSFVEGQNSVKGCWDERVWMAMKVEVEEVSIPKVLPATCDLLDVTKNGTSVVINKLNYTLNKATLNGLSINFGDGTTKLITTAQLPYSYKYAKEGNYSIQATVKTSLGDVTSSACVASVKPAPTQIPDTGAGNVIGIFGSVTLAGALLHNLIARRTVRK